MNTVSRPVLLNSSHGNKKKERKKERKKEENAWKGMSTQLLLSFLFLLLLLFLRFLGLLLLL